jgi:DNA-binding transcriptional ArsR family regulator
MVDEVLVLAPGDEQAQKVAKALGSPTAGAIISYLAEGPQSSTGICDFLSLPMSTVKYHIENLLDAGVLEIAQTRYSVKGREVKVYRLKNRVLIVAPRATDLKQALLKYTAVFGMMLLATLALFAFTPLLSNQAGTADLADQFAESGMVAPLMAPGESLTPNIEVPALTLAAIPPDGPNKLTEAKAMGSGDPTIPMATVTLTTAMVAPVQTPLATISSNLQEYTLAPTAFSMREPGVLTEETVIETVTPAISMATVTLTPTMVAPVQEPRSFAPEAPVSPALTFLAGGCVAIALLLIIEVLVVRRKKSGRVKQHDVSHDGMDSDQNDSSPPLV